MPYQLSVTNSAKKDIRRLPADIQRRVRQSINPLANEPRPAGSRKLRGAGTLYRIRVGDYRVVYDVDDEAHMITIIRVGHRRDVYRNL